MEEDEDDLYDAPPATNGHAATPTNGNDVTMKQEEDVEVDGDGDDGEEDDDSDSVRIPILIIQHELTVQRTSISSQSAKMLQLRSSFKDCSRSKLTPNVGLHKTSKGSNRSLSGYHKA